jgi:hypothetical protein
VAEKKKNDAENKLREVSETEKKLEAALKQAEAD